MTTGNKKPNSSATETIKGESSTILGKDTPVPETTSGNPGKPGGIVAKDKS